ncbi:MAG: hypothetical protein K0A99_04220 [Desulfoarculaceae bacterium]|nr:hypothetical protein [Desulfoarculaceae bacterium]
MKLTGAIKVVILLIVFSLFAAKGQTANLEDEKTNLDHQWALSLYGGVHAIDHIRDIITFDADYSDGNNVLVAALAREVYRSRRFLSFELEGQVGRHFGDDVNHWEFVALGLGRWHTFPWDHLVNTSFGAGAGFSFYTEISSVEKLKHDDAQRLLGYLALELTFGLPRLPHWDLLTRIHHRSGLFRVIGKGSSNYLTVGLRYTF